MSILRIGVDVGGTNTDGVLLDPSSTSQANRGILAWHKSPTTSNPSQGIKNVITTLLKNANVDSAEVTSVTIGTTQEVEHFINAVVEKDRNQPAPVAVIRLCGPFSRDVIVDGGLEVDGELISDVNKTQIAAECQIIKDKKITSIVVNGIFSPSDIVERQEERVAEWVRKYFPEANVVVLKEVANLGFIERENTSILNASILPFAKTTIRSFEHVISRLKLKCPLVLTQNNGTILPVHLVAHLPIRMFSGRPTNLMCGAAFLVQKEAEKHACHRHRTTTDVSMLLASGLPRQAAAVTEILGVRMNFSCPDVKSIGLGGRSIMCKPSATAKLTIGPNSIGRYIHTHGLVFGRDEPTATDYTIAAQGLTHIGDARLVPLWYGLRFY
ncbi:Hydantoinase/oxoprolinase-domain-containing protein [Mycena sp. CBHHK59/15]|nr:Hydantoinase/oxoprolinase-domain-containing protein [Mycena sp. CBHHK59/15]